MHRPIDISVKLNATGWQSWTTSPQPLLRIPEINYSPFSEDLPAKPLSPRKLKPPAVGWCSWHELGWNISGKRVIEQARWFSEHPEIPIKYIQIDDGYTPWGDWRKTHLGKFPQGIAKTAAEIRRLKFKPGVWIAPFLVDPASKLASEHPDWLVKKEGKVPDGLKLYPLSRFVIRRAMLDIRDNHVQKYLKETLEFLIEQSGFELIKFDFLYAPYFIPGIKAQEAFDFVHEFLAGVSKKYPDIYTIASGCPLTAAAGVVDSMRIGPDVTSPTAANWPLVSQVFHRHRVREVLNNLKMRSWTKEIWNVDPDGFVCRPSLGLPNKTIEELQKAIKESKGNIFLGDDMAKLSQDRIERFILPLFNS